MMIELRCLSEYEARYNNQYNYIESWYNRKRIHSAVNYLTPDEVERLCPAA